MYTWSSALDSKCQNINGPNFVTSATGNETQTKSNATRKKNPDILPWRDPSKARENELMRELRILSSWRIQFSAHFDELVRVYAWWMYGDECGNRINKSSAKGKLRDPESFTTSVRKDTISHCTYNSHPLCSNPYWQLQQQAFLAGNIWTLRWHLGLSGDFCSP